MAVSVDILMSREKNLTGFLQKESEATNDRWEMDE